MMVITICKLIDRLIRNEMKDDSFCHCLSYRTENWQAGVFDDADYESSITLVRYSKFDQC